MKKFIKKAIPMMFIGAGALTLTACGSDEPDLSQFANQGIDFSATAQVQDTWEDLQTIDTDALFGALPDLDQAQDFVSDLLNSLPPLEGAPEEGEIPLDQGLQPVIPVLPIQGEIPLDQGLQLDLGETVDLFEELPELPPIVEPEPEEEETPYIPVVIEIPFGEPEELPQTNDPFTIITLATGGLVVVGAAYVAANAKRKGES